MILRYLIISVISGILFAVLDGVINANPLARRLFEVYKPIARTSINPVAGIVIDLVYGFAMAGVFLLLYNSLPGVTGFIKGVSYAVMVWFFRTAMSTASQWMMYKIPSTTLLYVLATGLLEMLTFGILYGLVLKPII